LPAVGTAAKRLGVHPQMLRPWEANGRITALRVNDRGTAGSTPRTSTGCCARARATRTERHNGHAAYVRVSGRRDQMSSLSAQETELTDAAGGVLVAVFHDVGSGRSERRRNLQSALAA
jgi:predicted site-specific integrase-resolvase